MQKVQLIQALISSTQALNDCCQYITLTTMSIASPLYRNLRLFTKTLYNPNKVLTETQMGFFFFLIDRSIFFLLKVRNTTKQAASNTP